MREGALDGLPHLHYTNFQSLSDKKSLIVSPVFTVFTLREKKEVENCWGIEEGSVNGDCKDDFGNK